MAGDNLKFRHVHFVGSIPLASVDDVFREAGTLLGGHLRRMPDGELGPRLGWLRCQRPVFENHPAIELATVENDWRDGSGGPPAREKFRVKSGVESSTLHFGSLGYADWAIASYEKFIAARRAGVLPQTCRFQVCLPTPYAVTNVMFEQSSHSVVEASYTRAIETEIQRLLSNVRTSDLAVQWDVAQEIEFLASGSDRFFPITLSGLVASLAGLAGYLPSDAEVGLHFCYGDYQHRHFIEPTDTALMVNVMNAVWKASARPINFVHMPVPIDRSDDAYFRPLEGLERRPETELYLGLIHYADGLPGTIARMRTAERHLADFGIGTECGFGRRAPETIPALLRLHAAAAGGDA